MKAWMRILEIHLTSKKAKREMVFGANDVDNFNISVRGNKYMSTLKDNCTIRISNLTYSTIVQIISGEFYDVIVKCGYRQTEAFNIFKGAIIWVSNSLDDTKSNTVIILCGSELVATYSQSRLNLSLNSGINMYSALNFICKRAGIPNSGVSTQFKKQILKEVVECTDTAANWINNLCSTNSSYIVNSDSSSSESILTIYDANNTNARYINLTSDIINLTGGYPQLTKDGLSLSVMPTFNFVCGDVIHIDNSIIDISSTSQSEANTNKGYYIDKDGNYMVTEISYTLENRSSNFSINLLAKSRSLISNFIGQ